MILERDAHDVLAMNELELLALRVRIVEGMIATDARRDARLESMTPSPLRGTQPASSPPRMAASAVLSSADTARPTATDGA